MLTRLHRRLNKSVFIIIKFFKDQIALISLPTKPVDNACDVVRVTAVNLLDQSRTLFLHQGQEKAEHEKLTDGQTLVRNEQFGNLRNVATSQLPDSLPA